MYNIHFSERYAVRGGERDRYELIGEEREKGRRIGDRNPPWDHRLNLFIYYAYIVGKTRQQSEKEIQCLTVLIPYFFCRKFSTFPYI